MGKQRRHFRSEDKVKALRRHLIEKVPISDLCEELGIQPTQFYRWQQTLFENGSPFWNPNSSARTRYWASSWKSMWR